MKAVCWCGKEKVRVENVPDPKILSQHDAIVKITSTCICGSDLHLYDGFVPTMKKGDILGHEFMGEVVEVGRDVQKVKKGDRVIVPFAIACGKCWYCKQELWSCCDNTNPNATLANRLYNYSGSGLYGYSHLFGGFAGGQAEAARVVFADVNCFKIPEGLSDDQAVFLTDILPTAYQAAVNCGIRRGDVVAVWGCGPVGLLSQKCASLLGAERVIAIDRFADRLDVARRECGSEIINYEQDDLNEKLNEFTGGRGPDACIDAVGMESHTGGIVGGADWVKQKVMLESDRPHVLRQMMFACRKGGTLSIPGVYTGLIDHIPFGAAFAKAPHLQDGADARASICSTPVGPHPKGRPGSHIHHYAPANVG